jgi:hypothetical protein
MVRDRGDRVEPQLFLVRGDEELDAAAYASLFRDALAELLIEVFFEIAEGVEPIRIFGESRSIETVLIDEPNKNRLAAFSEPQHEEG